MKQISILFIAALFFLFSDSPAAAQSVKKSFPVTKGGTLRASINVGDIRINSWQKGEVLVEIQGIDPEDERRLEISQRGNDVVVDYNGGWSSGHALLTISVPVQYNLALETSAGDIRATGDVSGDIDINTSAGDIQLQRLSGKVSIHSSGGDIIVRTVDGNGTLHTSGGNIQIDSTSGGVELHTAGGDIQVGTVQKTLNARTAGGNVSVQKIGGDAKLATGGGDIEIQEIGGNAEITTGGGNIEIRRLRGTASLTTGGGDVYVTGGGKTFIKTGGGDVVLREGVGSLIAVTGGGDISAEMNPTGKEESRLKTGGGDVELYLPANAKATVVAKIRVRGRWSSSKEDYDVHSDFPAESYVKDDELHEIRGRYLINGGGETITLETMHGDIAIRRGKAVDHAKAVEQ